MLKEFLFFLMKPVEYLSSGKFVKTLQDII